MRELVHGAVGVDGRGFAEQNHRDGAKRNRDDRLSEVRFMDLCEVLKVQKKKLEKQKINVYNI